MDTLKCNFIVHFIFSPSYSHRCTQFMTEAITTNQVSVADAIRILSMADAYDMKQLKAAYMLFLAKNFTTSDEFVEHMTGQLIQEMLKRSDLPKEKQVLVGVLYWMKGQNVTSHNILFFLNDAVFAISKRV